MAINFPNTPVLNDTFTVSGRNYTFDGQSWVLDSFIGYTGSKGDIGFTGSQGVTGFTGSKGSDGTSVVILGTLSDEGSLPNTNNTNGDGYIINGDLWVWDGTDWNNVGPIQGPTGFTGSQGTQGVIGFTGSQGTQGTTGFTGSQGAGFTGSQGVTGFIGSRGTIGFTGSQGAGFTGSQGTAGFVGSIGFTGSQGAGFTGSQGNQGFTGSQGPAGGEGSTGFTGSQGQIGFTGSRGVTGFTGSAPSLGALSDVTVTTPSNGQVLTYDNGTWINDASAGGTEITISNNTATNATRYITFVDATTGTATALNVSDTKLYYNPSTGQLNATEFNSLSDAAYKEDLTEIENSLDLIKQITPYSFKWKEDGRSSYGVLAQELEKILPELVCKNSEGVKSVSYIPLIALLIDAVKRLAER